MSIASGPDKELTLIVTIKLHVKAPESITDEDIIDEFQENSNYNFDGTTNVAISNTEWLETIQQ